MINGIKLEGIPQLDFLKEWANISEKNDISFEYNDFFLPDILDDKNEVNRRIEAYNSLGRDTSYDTLHGAFFDMVINSSDRKIKEISRERYIQSIEIARRLNCRGVVFHTNYIVGFKSELYKDNWVKYNAEFYHELCEKFPDIEIFVENMFDNSPAMLSRLANECADISNFGVCLDVAHACLWYLPLDKWIDALKPHIRHMHINDNNLKEDDHLALGEGRIKYDFLKGNLPKELKSILIEVNGIEEFEKSYRYLENIREM